MHNDYSTPLPHEYVGAADLPDSFTWGDVNGVSYLTHSLNQQYVIVDDSVMTRFDLTEFESTVK